MVKSKTPQSDGVLFKDATSYGVFFKSYILGLPREDTGEMMARCWRDNGEIMVVCCARVNCNLANCLTKHFARAAVCAHVGIGAPRANVYFFGL